MKHGLSALYKLVLWGWVSVGL